MDRKFSLPLTKIVDFAKASDFRQRVKIVCGLYAPVPYFDNLWEGGGELGALSPSSPPLPRSEHVLMGRAGAEP